MSFEDMARRALGLHAALMDITAIVLALIRLVEAGRLDLLGAHASGLGMFCLLLILWWAGRRRS